MRRKLATFIISTCLIVSLVPTNIFAQSKSKEKVITISSDRELREFANSVNDGENYEGKVIKLTKDIEFDINMDKNLETIGDPNFITSIGFAGTFDGAGHTISNMNSTLGGLFYTISENGVVKNVILERSELLDAYFSEMGCISYENYGTIENCHNKMNIKGKSIGGIVFNNYSKVINCSNSGDFRCNRNGSGGIVAYNSGGIISNSYNIGNMKGEDIIGGIAGYNHATQSYNHKALNGIIQNCYNAGQIRSIYVTPSACGAFIGMLDGGVVKNSFCADESSQYAIGNSGPEMYITIKDSFSLPSSLIKTSSFVATLNKNIGNNTKWLKWELTSSSEYPTFVESYEVTFKNSKLGYTKTNHSYAYNGQTVTLTTVPNKKYKTSTVIVKTATGKKITVKKVNGKYQFTMPNSKVVVTTIFKKK